MIGRNARSGVTLCFFVLLFCSIRVANAQQQNRERAGPAQPAGYVAKPLKPTGWTPPMRPFTRLVDLKAMHKGEKEWSELVVQDEHLWSRYIQ